MCSSFNDFSFKPNNIVGILNKEQVFKWAKLISITGSSQILIQLFGLISGLIVIRLMPIKEYAWYTIANTLLGTLTILSDAGISTGVMAEGGKVWNNKELLGKVVVTGMRLRTKFALVSLTISFPILAILLYKQNASILNIFFISLSIIPAFLASLSDNLLEIPIKLHQDIVPLQKNQLLTSIIRLVLIGLTLLLYPFTYIALLGNGLPRLWANIKLRELNNNFFDDKQLPDKEIEVSILKLVSKLLPGAIYFSISGQITIWIISIFGKSTSIAQLGAFGRISMLLTLFNVIISTLIIPRYSKIQIPKALKTRTIQIQVALFAFFAIILLITYCFSGFLLQILGKQYFGLNYQMFLSVAVSCMALLCGITFSLYTSKGWAIKPLIYLPINIISLIIGLFIFNFQTLEGVLYIGIFTGLTQYTMNIVFLIYNINLFQKTSLQNS